MEIYLIRTLNGLKPAFEEDQKKINKFGLGEVVEFKTTIPRDYHKHKKFMAMIRITFENQEEFNNFDHFREAVIIEAGYYDVIPGLFGQGEKKVAKSISFSKMDEPTFEELFDKCADVCIKVIGCDKEELIKEVLLLAPNVK